MRQLIKWLPDKQLANVMSINSLSVLVRLFSGFLLSKFIAIFIGPQGLGLIGNLTSFLKSIQSIASLGFYNGIVKFTAEFKEDNETLSKVLSTAYLVGFLGVVGTSVILIAFTPFFGNLIFNSNKYDFVIKILAISSPFFILNYYCLAFLNGLGEYKRYTYINIITSLLGLVISLLLVWKFKLSGILVSIVIVPAIAILITSLYVVKQLRFLNLLKRANYDKKYLSEFSEYTLMTLVTALVIPPTLIAIRNHIVRLQGLDEMGYWEAMNRISNYYLVFITSLLTLYLYPKLAKVKTNQHFKKELVLFYKQIMPLVIIGLLVLYTFRKIIIKILFTEAFLPMESLFAWQLSGDLFRVLSAIIAYQFMAKKMTKQYVITEILSAAIWYGSSVYFINNYGYLGASIGYLICYFFYLLMLLFCFRKELFFKI